jgi:hypothetical protein
MSLSGYSRDSALPVKQALDFQGGPGDLQITEPPAVLLGQARN